MADNVPITAGSGTDIATDDVSSVHFQKVKLDVGGDGATDPVAKDVTGKLPVTAQGAQAHDASDSNNNPVKIGAKAVAHGSNPSAVAAGDVTDLYTNRHGVPFVTGGHPNVKTQGFELTSGTSNAALVSVSAGTKIVVTQIQIVAGTDLSTTPSVRVGFGTASTPAIGSAGVVAGHPAIPGGGGVSRGDGSGIVGIGADDEDLRYTVGTITGGLIWVLVSWYEVPS